jgi:hypothetical protein
LAGFAFANPENCSGYLTLPYPNDKKTLPPGEELQLSVASNKRFALSLGSGVPAANLGARTCGLIVSFAPQPRHHYVMAFDWQGGQCTVSLSRFDSNSGVGVPEPTFVKREQVTGQLITLEACR